MTINVKTIRQSRRENVLAEAVLEIADGDEDCDGGYFCAQRAQKAPPSADIITIDNAQILRNKQGNLWLAMPSYSVPLPGAKGYQYLPVVVLTKELRRRAEDAALAAYERWAESQGEIPAKRGGEPAGERNSHSIIATDAETADLPESVRSAR